MDVFEAIEAIKNAHAETLPSNFAEGQGQPITAEEFLRRVEAVLADLED